MYMYMYITSGPNPKLTNTQCTCTSCINSSIINHQFTPTSDCILMMISSVFHFPLRGLYMCLVATSSSILSNPSPTHGSARSFVFCAANSHCFFTDRPPNFLLPNVYEATCLRGCFSTLYAGVSSLGRSPSEWVRFGRCCADDMGTDILNTLKHTEERGRRRWA